MLGETPFYPLLMVDGRKPLKRIGRKKLVGAVRKWAKVTLGVDVDELPTGTQDPDHSVGNPVDVLIALAYPDGATQFCRDWSPTGSFRDSKLLPFLVRGFIERFDAGEFPEYVTGNVRWQYDWREWLPKKGPLAETLGREAVAA